MDVHMIGTSRDTWLGDAVSSLPMGSQSRTARCTRLAQRSVEHLPVWISEKNQVILQDNQEWYNTGIPYHFSLEIKWHVYLVSNGT